MVETISTLRTRFSVLFHARFASPEDDRTSVQFAASQASVSARMAVTVSGRSVPGSSGFTS